jgi:hypothetical protein
MVGGVYEQRRRGAREHLRPLTPVLRLRQRRARLRWAGRASGVRQWYLTPGQKVRRMGHPNTDLSKASLLADEESLMAAAETAGPSTTLRSGRDDNFVAGVRHCSVASIPATTELSSRPERTRISYFALLAATTCAALRRESRMIFLNATTLHRKSGGA